MAKTEWRKGVSLDEGTLKVLRERIQQGSDLAELAAEVGVAAATLARAAAGLGVRNGSAKLIRMTLEKRAA